MAFLQLEHFFHSLVDSVSDMPTILLGAFKKTRSVLLTWNRTNSY